MKNTVFVLLLAILFSCGKNKDLTVKVDVKGLKKGTIYLKKAQDTTILTVDSLIVHGEEPIELYSELDSPEVFFLQLDKNSKEDEVITFFAEKGITEVSTNVKNFGLDAKIKGSKQQVALEEYMEVMSRFNDRNLNLIKERFDALKTNDSALIRSNEKAKNALLKNKYLYTVNFAMKNNDNEVAPYIVLTEIADAQIKWLDTVNNALTPKVKESKYGKKLEDFIAERKKS
ncbi:DUF4369 domain-containing protein [Oceanihabitans sediminis]|uniref:DUF4369 domain-containing protein n=1 Tax=Oceanihabitans sediminis TaxID=1812012 RepID=A0A368P405_9FLAO|nr:DUF4369 domain-containing protein [Oceanihabitans sediminis]MDX1277829.1 DUF4369 domain-containing protein [Oceanihabitans sediminis]RBP29835.1 uncharacterized protein DUF4369 [Oceanihabitans sediminis]RCU57176.1 DUF4369 domain-containing protein [Oceanihabitans sediminis]